MFTFLLITEFDVFFNNLLIDKYRSRTGLNGFVVWKACMMKLFPFSASLLCSFRRASLLCVTSSSCAGLHTVMCPTPRKPSLAFWLRFTTGRGSVGKDAPLFIACESAYIHLHHPFCFLNLAIIATITTWGCLLCTSTG